MDRILRRGAIVLLSAICMVALVLTSISMGQRGAQASAVSPQSMVTALPGYKVSVFARGTAAYFSPDSVEVDGKYVYIGYQNGAAVDGIDKKSSAIVQYTREGKIVRKYSVLGHCDGLRVDPRTHLVWATSNEDANARLTIINPTTGEITTYQIPTAPHGGGYDDLAFLNGKVFVSASNPTLNSAGVNTAPAVQQITLSNGKAIFTPVLYGNATAIDAVTHQKVTLNLTDPDSMSIDNKGNLVLDSQGDSELIFIHNPGTSTQTVTHLAVGTQVDDSAWATAKEGRLFIVDSKQNTIYNVNIYNGFIPGTAYTEAPGDSGVAGFVGKLDVKTGTITPIIIGLTSPSGLVFTTVS